MNDLALLVPDGTSRLNLTFNGMNSDFADTVRTDSTDAEVRGWVTEALRHGDIPGMPASPGADLTDFVVDRFSPTEARPFSLISVRPKTPFGA